MVFAFFVGFIQADCPSAGVSVINEPRCDDVVDLLVLEDNFFANLHADEDGGAVTSHNLTATNCCFRECSCGQYGDLSQIYGGAIFLGDDGYCTRVVGDSCSANYGGFIASVQGPSEFANCRMLSCVAAAEGGAMIVGYYYEAAQQVRDANFTACMAPHLGAAIAANCQVDATMPWCLFLDCHGEDGGGSCVHFHSCDRLVTLMTCHFINYSAVAHYCNGELMASVLLLWGCRFWGEFHWCPIDWICTADFKVPRMYNCTFDPVVPEDIPNCENCKIEPYETWLPNDAAIIDELCVFRVPDPRGSDPVRESRFQARVTSMAESDLAAAGLARKPFTQIVETEETMSSHLTITGTGDVPTDRLRSQKETRLTDPFPASRIAHRSEGVSNSHGPIHVASQKNGSTGHLFEPDAEEQTTALTVSNGLTRSGEIRLRSEDDRSILAQSGGKLESYGAPGSNTVSDARSFQDRSKTGPNEGAADPDESHNEPRQTKTSPVDPYSGLLSVGAIAGIAAAGVALIALAILLFYLLRRHDSNVTAEGETREGASSFAKPTWNFLEDSQMTQTSPLAITEETDAGGEGLQDSLGIEIDVS